MSEAPEEPATPRQTEDPPRVPPPDQPRVEPFPRLPDDEGEDEDAGSDCDSEDDGQPYQSAG